jgi:DNA-binding MarR family transcriptional regulator
VKTLDFIMSDSKELPVAIDVGIDAQPGHLIRRLHQISVGLFVQEMAGLGEHGITPVQYAALQTVANSPGVDQRTLARAIALDASTTGGVVDRLEARGLLARFASTGDRRVRLLHPTEDGLALLQRLVPVMLKAQERILAPLAPQQRGQFLHLLNQLVKSNNEFSRAPSDSR